MTDLSDRANELIDLACVSVRSGRIDLVRDADVRDIFQLVYEVLEPALADRDAEIVRLKAELQDLRATIVQRGIESSLERVRMGRVCR